MINNAVYSLSLELVRRVSCCWAYAQWQKTRVGKGLSEREMKKITGRPHC